MLHESLFKYKYSIINIDDTDRIIRIPDHLRTELPIFIEEAAAASIADTKPKRRRSAATFIDLVANAVRQRR
jgi:hypothetical protein